ARPDRRAPREEGPQPLWSYRGRLAAADRLGAMPTAPVIAGTAGLLSLAPATGTPLRTLDIPTDPPGASPDSPAAAIHCAGTLALTTRQDRLLALDLLDPQADWSVRIPGTAAEPVTAQVTGCDPQTVYGRTTAGRPPSATTELFAVSLRTRALLWRVPCTGPDVWLSSPVLAGPGLLLATRGGQLLRLDTDTGAQRWAVPIGEQSVRTAADADHCFLLRTDGSVTAVALSDGSTTWSTGTTAGAQWRGVGLSVADGRLVVLRDTGEVLCHDARTGARQWSQQLPFPLDPRTRPVPAGRQLVVPGPADAGVVALDAATGERRWQYRDRLPATSAWSATTDGRHLYVGHDRVLHALPLS
ncbi:PQQ-binding-like beta-propeller repeat protein, partial [Kitasatospora sp. NPDC058965]|uniref:outer membrane protein assembly factor BamB family protein n=1 Tax=Kitasatospora sp. NPDC058965 TaxID=3346682 RepID=UPI0036A2CECF